MLNKMNKISTIIKYIKHYSVSKLRHNPIDTIVIIMSFRKYFNKYNTNYNTNLYPTLLKIGVL